MSSGSEVLDLGNSTFVVSLPFNLYIGNVDKGICEFLSFRIANFNVFISTKYIPVHSVV